MSKVLDTVGWAALGALADRILKDRESANAFQVASGPSDSSRSVDSKLVLVLPSTAEAIDELLIAAGVVKLSSIEDSGMMDPNRIADMAHLASELLKIARKPVPYSVTFSKAPPSNEEGENYHHWVWSSILKCSSGGRVATCHRSSPGVSGYTSAHSPLTMMSIRDGTLTESRLDVSMAQSGLHFHYWYDGFGVDRLVRDRLADEALPIITATLPKNRNHHILVYAEGMYPMGVHSLDRAVIPETGIFYAVDEQPPQGRANLMTHGPVERALCWTSWHLNKLMGLYIPTVMVITALAIFGWLFDGISIPNPITGSQVVLFKTTQPIPIGMMTNLQTGALHLLTVLYSFAVLTVFVATLHIISTTPKERGLYSKFHWFLYNYYGLPVQRSWKIALGYICVNVLLLAALAAMIYFEWHSLLYLPLCTFALEISHDFFGDAFFGRLNAPSSIHRKTHCKGYAEEAESSGLNLSNLKVLMK